MLSTIRKALARRTIGKRDLFAYSDGQQIKHGDPFRIFRAIVNDPRIDIARDQPLIDVGAEPETSKAIQVLMDAFGVTHWDGETGLTDWEILNLLVQFSEYMEALKKNTNSSATLSPTTDTKSSTGPECPNEATSSYSPSTCSPSESNSDEALAT